MEKNFFAQNVWQYVEYFLALQIITGSFNNKNQVLVKTHIVINQYKKIEPV